MSGVSGASGDFVRARALPGAHVRFPLVTCARTRARHVVVDSIGVCLRFPASASSSPLPLSLPFLWWLPSSSFWWLPSSSFWWLLFLLLAASPGKAPSGQVVQFPQVAGGRVGWQGCWAVWSDVGGYVEGNGTQGTQHVSSFNSSVIGSPMGGHNGLLFIPWAIVACCLFRGPSWPAVCSVGPSWPSVCSVGHRGLFCHSVGHRGWFILCRSYADMFHVCLVSWSPFICRCCLFPVGCGSARCCPGAFLFMFPLCVWFYPPGSLEYVLLIEEASVAARYFPDRQTLGILSTST